MHAGRRTDSFYAQGCGLGRGCTPFLCTTPLPPRKIGFLSPYPARPYPPRFATKLEAGGFSATPRREQNATLNLTARLCSPSRHAGRGRDNARKRTENRGNRDRLARSVREQREEAHEGADRRRRGLNQGVRLQKPRYRLAKRGRPAGGRGRARANYRSEEPRDEEGPVRLVRRPKRCPEARAHARRQPDDHDDRVGR